MPLKSFQYIFLVQISYLMKRNCKIWFMKLILKAYFQIKPSLRIMCYLFLKALIIFVLIPCNLWILFCLVHISLFFWPFWDNKCFWIVLCTFKHRQLFYLTNGWSALEFSAYHCAIYAQKLASVIYFCQWVLE